MARPRWSSYTRAKSRWTQHVVAESLAWGSSEQCGERAPMLVGTRILSWGSQFKFVPGAGNGAIWRLGYYISWCSHNNDGAAMWGPVLVLTTAGVGRFFALQLTGSGANWWRRSQRARLSNGMCALRLTQRRTPNNHGHPPTSPCSSRMMCESHANSPHQEALTCE